LLDVAALVDFIYRGRVDPLNGIEYEISLNITPDTIILEIVRPPYGHMRTIFGGIVTFLTRNYP
jgi:hypothetical protein